MSGTNLGKLKIKPDLGKKFVTEEQRLAVTVAAKKQRLTAEAAAGERNKTELIVGKLRLETEGKNLAQSHSGEQLDPGFIEITRKALFITSFVDAEDNLDAYLCTLKGMPTWQNGINRLWLLS